MEQDTADKKALSTETFLRLLVGLHVYLNSERSEMSPHLRHAMNVLAFAQLSAFPKTIHQFIHECHDAPNLWKLSVTAPAVFDSSQPILSQNQLSAEAQEFCMAMSESLQIDVYRGSLPQTALDNLIMIDLRKTLQQWPDRAEAQHTYVAIRSFLSTYSICTVRDLRRQTAIWDYVPAFYEDVPPLPHPKLPVCPRCGLLEWVDDAWHGVKPTYCSDHNPASLTWINNEARLQRLKRGIHLRTFIPGQAELAVFSHADNRHAEFPLQLVNVERYPGLDTYDLRLTFSDGEVWAVDVKDHTSPLTFIEQVKSLYNLGDLKHDQAFYVIPDARMDDWAYRNAVNEKRDSLPRNSKLDIATITSFQQLVDAKLESLTRPLNKKPTPKR
ncbi:MAG: hypothetical protein SF162_16605 [bacterium]|nr:hypothetical protein [bacterium]